MNDVDKEEDYSDYETYVNDFYKRYKDYVGFEILHDNIWVPNTNLKLNKLISIHNFESTMDKIYKKIIEKRSELFLSDDELYLFDTGYQINWIRSHAEFSYKFNSIFFLPCDINARGNIDLDGIRKKLKYTSDQYKKLKKYFFMDIRNALSHTDYRYELDDNIKFKYIICKTDDGIIKLDRSKIILITKKIIKLAMIQKELIKYYKIYH